MPVLLPLADIVGLIAALIVLFAAYVIFKGFLQSLAGRVPVIGHFLNAVIDLVITDSINWVYAQFKSAISGLVGFFAAPIHWIASLIENIIFQMYNIATALAHLAGNIIPGLRAELLALINTGVAEAEGYAARLDAQLYQALNAGLQAVYTYIATEVSDVDHYILSEIAAADAYITSEIAQVTAYIQSVDTELTAYVATAEHIAETYAETLYQSAIAYAQSAVITLGGDITADLSGLQSWIDSQITALQAAIAAALAQAIAYTDARVLAVETTIEDLKANCLDNLCSNLSPLANLFNALSDVWTTAALVELGTTFATDPAGAAGEVRAVLGDVVDGTVSVIKDAVGV